MFVFCRFLDEYDIEPEPFTETLIAAIPDLESLRQSAFARPLQAAISKLTNHSGGAAAAPGAGSTNQIAPVMKLTNEIRQMSAVVTSPVESPDTPLRFIAGLTLAVPVDARLENVDDVDSILVEVINGCR